VGVTGSATCLAERSLGNLVHREGGMIVGIFATGRNGSTLLLRLLDGIPDAYVHPVEVNFLSVMNDLVAKGRLGSRSGANASTKPLKYIGWPIETRLLIRAYRFHVDTMTSEYFSRVDGYKPIGRDPLQKLKEKGAYTSPEFVLEFLQAFSSWVSGEGQFSHYIFKTIETPYVKDYEINFPEMRFIHILRDPMDMYSSQKRTLMFNKALPSWYLGWDNLDTMIHKRWIPHARAVLERLGDERHYFLRFEDLIRNPGAEIKAICRWLGVKAPRLPSTQTVLGGLTPRDLPGNPSKKGVKTPLEVVPDLRERHSYEEVLTPREKVFIAYFTRPYVEALGYRTAVEGMTVPKLLNMWWKPEKWEWMHQRGIIQWAKGTIAFFLRRGLLLKGVLCSRNR